MAAEITPGLVVTWLLANGSAISVVWKFLTAPIHQKIETIEKYYAEKFATYDKRLEKLDGYVNPRASMIDSAPTVAELVRRVQELEAWQKEVDELKAELVIHEEFRAYTATVAAKLEKLSETLGWIKGRIGAWGR